jgi:hypothetical protein
LRNMTLEEKFRKDLIDSIARHDLAGTIRAQQNLENLKSTGFNKKISVKAITDGLNKSDRDRILKSLNRIPVMADILEALLVDFLEEIERVDSTIVMQNITPDVINIKKSATNIRKLMNSGGEKVAERFGELCDRVKLVIDNEFSRMEVEGKRKMA